MVPSRGAAVHALLMMGVTFFLGGGLKNNIKTSFPDTFVVARILAQSCTLRQTPKANTSQFRPTPHYCSSISQMRSIVDEFYFAFVSLRFRVCRARRTLCAGKVEVV